MQSVVPTIVVTILYIFVVLAGMKFMEKREPLKLGNLLFYYNVALVVLNLHIFGPSQVTLAVRLIGGGDQCTQRKPLANFIPIPSTPRHEWDLNSQL
jgi:hypothetical protein